jgi:hypothetical protein
MPSITKEDIRKLQNDPLSFAILMEDRHIEHIIVTFVSVLNKKKPKRGDQN